MKNKHDCNPGEKPLENSDTKPSTSETSDANSAADLQYANNLREDLLKAFESITTPGTFAAWEALATPPPAGLHVEGAGNIAMPMSLELKDTVKSLHALDGTVIAENYHLYRDQSLEYDPFEDLEVAKEDYKPYMGNEGPHATHWYRRAALVMVPYGSQVRAYPPKDKSPLITYPRQ
ncbi:hypothetical protein PtB15_3B443 [Puccinia triticina]|nr:hypothetical protein PtB15_3B443 [Puccinia triticina]